MKRTREGEKKRIDEGRQRMRTEETEGKSKCNQPSDRTSDCLQCAAGNLVRTDCSGDVMIDVDI